MEKTEIMNKINKLLKLAKSSNENEAKAAMLRVQELLMKNKLTMAEVKNAPEDSKVLESESCISYTKGRWKSYLATVIAENFNCCTFTRLIRQGYNKVTKVIYFIGKEEDITVCNATIGYAVECITEEVKKLKKQYKKDGQSVAGLELDYASSFINGLKESFKEQVESNKDTWGLVVQTPEEVLKVYNAKNIKTSSLKIRSYDDKVSSKGYNDGKNFNTSNKVRGTKGMTALA